LRAAAEYLRRQGLLRAAELKVLTEEDYARVEVLELADFEPAII